MELVRWTPALGWEPVPPEPAGRLLAADSWLVQDGNARGLDLHERRFASAVADAGGPAAETATFWSAALARLPREGAWFPRVEFVATDTGRFLQLRVRPAPERTRVVTVAAVGVVDRRRVPRRKGPDLAWLGSVRGAANGANGADDVLLTTSSGVLRETATAGLVWWEDGVMCVPDPALRVLPSVTTALLRGEAAARGVRVRHRRARLADLAGREVWIVNALHGVRPVVEWLGAEVAVGAADRAPDWRRWWDCCARPMPGA
ncbi:Branched-chain amino acid aminotransferase/4-amino-4-deoxychorismate lyase [Streptoalloteichus tenebrarius]|uniref:Branched-chain amino acid aminotransferase/4-amino-4-deoxychorismate lyase n=1 Tax=Streptoalloteichus tenebrarius (strain ATCC 17920 / DSM 40477 / JCM 4838 / CBS 697.72 / NBRC 16177 / NCIMB 11028 / NRRL B-12390 / A12253. 1 / ISP 5477) TaxID=1933 RepID=A0ABT1I3X7_STRSD|nr:aminotransferase class IV [Streptoalloteichus tenebrarius]MCP2262501.1 Branched-chain amino acid aminotransferase/4-amino-4-deoxychorismate lyase [Streptoalloteichus tenebrarius]BFE99661.1 aminotransferase class IV [Streptoalloteichus tenebrarius]